jgi:hypothetical protein
MAGGPTTRGAVRVYSHCPPVSPIRYDDVTVDDDLQRVELVCPDETTDITTRFARVHGFDDLLPHYASEPIEVPPQCRVDFTVKDTIGGSIGLWFRASRAP